MKNTMTKILFAFLLTATCGLTIFAQTGNWKKMPGLGKEAMLLAIGAGNAVWAVDVDSKIYKFENNKWTKTDLGYLPEGTVIDKIVVDPDGFPWVLAGTQIYQLVNNKWTQMPGRANDIFISPLGLVWIVGASDKTGARDNNPVLQWNETKRTWDKTKDPAAIQIADSGGADASYLLSVRNDGSVWFLGAPDNAHATNGKWVKMPGVVGWGGISIGGDGTAWLLGDAEVEGSDIYRLDNASNTWKKMDGRARNIAVDMNGKAWIISRDGNIYMYSENMVSTTPKPKPTKTKRTPAGLDKYKLAGDIPYIKISFKKGDIYSDVSGTLSNFDDVKWYSAKMSGKSGEMMVVDPEGQPESRGIHITVKDPLGEIVGGDDDTCNNRVEVPQTSQGDYVIVITQCDADNSWDGKFSFRLGAGPGKLF